MGDSPTLLINAIWDVRDMINSVCSLALSYEHLAERVSVQTYCDVQCLVVDLTDMMVDGLAEGCTCENKLEPGVEFHGTKNLPKMFATRGVMEDAKQPLTKNGGRTVYDGWYHAPDFERALGYAGPHGAFLP
eukprot:769563-Karenia_brevis.AAC.1